MIAADRSRACISYWLPRLMKAEGVRIPKTVLVTTDLPLWSVLEPDIGPMNVEDWRSFVAVVGAAAETVGGFPCFLRTGHGSGKHQWRETCFVPAAGAFPRHICNLVEWSAMVDMIGLNTNVWAVRELLKLESSFTAFDGFPVSRERRFFIAGKDNPIGSQRGVLCSHAYWPEGAVEQGRPSVENWRERLAILNETTADEEQLYRMSLSIAEHFEGCWSLDWARDVDGVWWAIDMAPAELSFHWPECRIGDRIADAAQRRGRRA